MRPTYTGRKDFRRDGQDHFAEITVRAEPGEPPSQVNLSSEVLADLHAAFGPDFEHQRHNVWAAVIVQIDTTNLKDGYPHAGAASFHAEVVGFRISEGSRPRTRRIPFNGGRDGGHRRLPGGLGGNPGCRRAEQGWDHAGGMIPWRSRSQRTGRSTSRGVGRGCGASSEAGAASPRVEQAKKRWLGK